MTIFVPAAGGGTPTGVAGVYDYNSLKQAVQDWFARSDMGNWIDYFIQIAEADIYRDIFTGNQGKGVQAIEASLSETISGASAALPLGYLAMKILLISANGQTFEVERKTPEFIYTQYPDQTASGTPAYFARLGNAFVFGPYPDAAYSLSGIYWKKSPQLTSVNSVTWMTNTIPTILLAAVNRAAARFNKDQEAYGLWDSLYQQQLASFILADKSEELSGSSLAMVAA
ncbi:phage adaptor protein [Paraburkholderia sediminicola]|uniref:phage adaptor protein n=1 Tax=Paraburkholderia sediminicola TaxID=458836 RepID=UPI0038BC24D1